MNPISEFLVDHIIAVFFLYGLAFFTLGLALLFAARRRSEFRFAAAVTPLALFGLLHGAHEWIEMFQKMAAAQGAPGPSAGAEWLRTAILATSFVMLQIFAILLLAPAQRGRVRFWPAAALAMAWATTTALIVRLYGLDAGAAAHAADALARYLLGIPGAVMAAWALMAQQRHFRAAGMPQFGRDLVWCAAALLLYGLVGQAFIGEGALPFPIALSNANFLRWFGIPVQVLRAAAAAILTAYMIRVLQAFEVEERRRLEEANQAKLEAERRARRQALELNEELRLAAHKLSLLLDIANLLDAPLDWQERLRQALDQIVKMLSFADAGLILFAQQDSAPLHVAASAFSGAGKSAANGAGSSDDLDGESRDQAVALGERAIAESAALCLHADGHVIRFTLHETQQPDECRAYPSPTRIMALPLLSGGQALGSLVLLHTAVDPYQLSMADLNLVSGIAQQLGASVENARLHQEARAREQMLAALLHSVVEAQESERQRIARELHDATGQSLTAVALGLRGVEMQLGVAPHELAPQQMAQIRQQLQELQTFSTGALRELRQVIADLRPPQLDDLGLAAAMRWYIRAYEQRRNLEVRLETEGDESHLSAEFKTVLFRIMQEALTNVAKHARARTAAVRLAITPAEVRLSVEDDGQGFDPVQLARDVAAPQGWGLVGIRERAILLGGQCTVDSALGRGTAIHIRAPLPAPSPRKKPLEEQLL